MELTVRKKKMFAMMCAFIVGMALLSVIIYMRERSGGPGPSEGADVGARPVPPPNIPVTTGGNDNNEPTIAINPLDPDNMVAGSNDYNTPDGDSWPGYYTTHDGGSTWTENLIPGYPGDSGNSALSGFKGGGDPVLMSDSQGNFYYAGIAFKRSVNPLNPIGFGINLGVANCVFVARSSDGGDNFDQVVVVWAALQNLVRFNDKEWIAVDPINGNVYMVWAVFVGLMVSRLMFSRSTDGGASWSTPLIISEFTSGEMSIQGAAVVVDRDSNIHVTWINFGTENVRYARSTDQGQSFSDPMDISSVTPIPRYLDNGNYRTPCMTMLAVDNSVHNTSGSLYVTWADLREGDADIFLASSSDNGATWGEGLRVNNDTIGNGKDQFFPAVSVSDEGWAHVTFYDRRNDTANTMLEYWWAISFDGGRTFPVNTPLSDTFFNGDHSREGDNDFIGDYTGVVTFNSTLASVWCDTREGSEDRGDTEIYAAIFNYRDYLKTYDLGYEIPWPEPVSEKDN